MKIYTRTGDAGKTSLVGGKRVDKHSTRLEAYGTIDELNSYLGLLAAEPVIAREKATSSTLTTVQSRLFDIGAYLATDNTDNPGLQPSGLSESDVAHLERQIDIITPQLPQLKSPADAMPPPTPRYAVRYAAVPSAASSPWPPKHQWHRWWCATSTAFQIICSPLHASPTP